MKKILLFFSALFIFLACQKNEYITYTEKSALTFINKGSFSSADSLTFSFISNAVQGDRDTVWLPILLTGNLANSNLPFALEIVDGSTAVEQQHFELPETIFPANTVTYYYPLVLLRAEGLQTEIRTLSLRIVENENFALGPVSGTESFTLNDSLARTYSTLKLNITDQAVQPSWWGAAETYYFGTYSNERYRFMIEVCGISNFSASVLSFPLIINYQSLLRAAITEYERVNGQPLRDENNAIIIF